MLMNYVGENDSNMITTLKLAIKVETKDIERIAKL